MPDDLRPRGRRRVRVEHVMGTAISLDLRAPWVEETALEAFFAWLQSVDDRFSTYRAGSLVSRLRRGEISVDQTDADFHEVLAMCAEARRVSDGAFDIWRCSPDGMDPSGLVKGWSIDRGARILLDAGARNFCVNAGGDVLARGEAAPGLPWRIGIRHPRLAGKVAAVLAGRDLAVATSGTYERGPHIVDPIRGGAPSGLLSVTVSGPQLAFADAYATAAFAMGSAGPGWMSRLAGHAGLAITTSERVVWTKGMNELRVA